MSNEIATYKPDTQLSYLDTAVQTFEGIQKLAELMAKCGTMPAHLCGKPSDCFRVVVQAAKWRMDPFAVAECTSLVHGKMCYEGKLIAAVLQSTGAIEGRLEYEITGSGMDAKIVVTGTPRGGKPVSIRGSVKEWRTTGNGSPWDKQPETQLVYRGTRQWARVYAPEAILGVIAPEEVQELREVHAEIVEVPEPKKAKKRQVTAATEDDTSSNAVAEPTTSTAEVIQRGPKTNISNIGDLENLAGKLVEKVGRDKAVPFFKGVNVDLGIARLGECPAEKWDAYALEIEDALDGKFDKALKGVQG